ncbi:MAG: GNAT family N-acetyltransferase [Candidatus Dormibacteraceae bacterium]
MANPKVEVRAATSDDLAAINDIYNRYILEAHYTFDLEPWTMEARREWFARYGSTGRYRVLVATSQDRVVGYANSSRYRTKAAYDVTVETSIYLEPESVGRGAGSRLYQELFKILDGEDLHRANAGITLPNPASIALHERLGFKRVAVFTEQGRKFDRYWDVAWYEKPLGVESTEPS